MSTTTTVFNAIVIQAVLTAAGKEGTGTRALQGATDGCIQKMLDVLAALVASTAKRDKLDWPAAVTAVIGKSLKTNIVRQEVAVAFEEAAEAAGWGEKTPRLMAQAFFACLRDRQPFSRSYLTNNKRPPQTNKTKIEKATAAFVTGINHLVAEEVEGTLIQGIVKALAKAGVEIDYNPE